MKVGSPLFCVGEVSARYCQGTVSFVFVENDKGEKIPNGTCFFVGMPKDKQGGWGYLVTSDHVLRKPDGKFFDKVWVRFNTRAGGAEFVEVSLSDPKQQIVYSHPSDANVDIAVIPVVIPEVLDVIFLPLSDLTSREEFTKLGISEGSEVFFSGLFTAFYGQGRNYPIFRFGRVALLSDENIPWQEEGKPRIMLELYLVESQSFGGNSGSPVFFYFGADRIPGSIVIGSPEVKLAGIMKGNFNTGTAIRMVSNATFPVSIQNVGIAAVVPSYLLREILMSEALQARRNKDK